MLTRRIIPCLDVRNGEVLKGTRFSNLEHMGAPAELAARYEEEGADEIVFLDVSATLEGRAALARTVAEVRRVLSLPLTVGGGVRSVDDAAALLAAGADKVSVNSAAVANTDLVARLAARFGTQCTVVAIDARRMGSRWKVVVKSGREPTEIDAVEWACRAAGLGAGEILLTSWDRDGTGLGYDEELVRAVAGAVRIPVIASGGARGPQDFHRALEAGADAVLAAGLFHRGEWGIGAVKAELSTLGWRMRT